MAADPTRIWIDAADRQEALCVLGALGDYRARLARRGDVYRIEVDVDREFAPLMRALHRAVRNCLAENGLGSVVFHVGGRDYTLSAA